MEIIRDAIRAINGAHEFCLSQDGQAYCASMSALQGPHRLQCPKTFDISNAYIRAKTKIEEIPRFSKHGLNAAKKAGILCALVVTVNPLEGSANPINDITFFSYHLGISVLAKRKNGPKDWKKRVMRVEEINYPGAYAEYSKLVNGKCDINGLINFFEDTYEAAKQIKMK